jgi:hypothetical protein
VFRGSIDWVGASQFRRGDHNKSQRRNFYLPEPGQTSSQESSISRCKTCFWQCLSENGNTGSSRLHSYYLDWSQRVRRLKTLNWIVHAQLTADIRRLYKLKDLFPDSAMQYFHLSLVNILSRLPRNRQRWLQLARLVAARASDRSAGQQILSTFYPYKPSSSRARSTSPPTLAISPILQKLSLRSFYLTKHLPPIPEEPP